jgi:hypothetical protein
LVLPGSHISTTQELQGLQELQELQELQQELVGVEQRVRRLMLLCCLVLFLQ